ncbi:MAG TPA: TonB-dependent receptor plug domain-containing protein [Mangrovimonas sp.]|nr:TonB-dependent receptor plug domain-containing protein [Mangrovimonas sp.]
MGKKFGYLVLISFFLSVSGFAQNTAKETKPLADILSQLEQRFQISFSYADETIAKVYVEVPDSSWNLTQTLEFIESQTPLKFTILDHAFIAITSLIPNQTGFEVQELQEVVVGSYLTSGISRNNNGITSIKPQQFGILPGMIEPDVLQTIQALPGVMSVDETISNINIRGGTHDQNLILWDGIKMYQSGHFFGLISAFNPYLTQHVDVSKNGTSARYGDGVSSVIDMQNANELSHHFKAGVGLNMTHMDGFLVLPLGKKTELQFSTRRSITDWIDTPTYDSYFDRVFQDTDLTNNGRDLNGTISKDERFYFYDVSAKLLTNLTEKDRLRFNFLTISNDVHYREQSTINDENTESNSFLKQNSLSGGATYLRTWNSKFNTSLQFYGSKYDLDANNQDVVNNQRLIQENKVLEYAVKLDTDWFINNHFKLSSGYQFFETGISNLEDVNNPRFKSYIKEVVRTHSVYSELKYLSSNLNTNVKVGARANYYEKFDVYKLEPRVSFSQRFLNYFRFELLGELKTQTTSQIIDLQNDFLGIEKRRWILANNESIPIIESKQASAGIHYSQNQLLVSAETYLKHVDNITSRSQGFQNQFQYVKDIGSYEVVGLDVLVNKQFENTSAWLSYSYSKNTYQFDIINNGKAFPNNVDIQHAVTFGATHTLGNLKLAIGVNWHTGKPFTEPNNDDPVIGNNVNYNAPNSSNLKDYFRADFSATYRLKLSETTNAVAGISLWNLTNQENIINSYYKLEDDEVIRIDNTSLGLTPNASLRVSF